MEKLNTTEENIPVFCKCGGIICEKPSTKFKICSKCEKEFLLIQIHTFKNFQKNLEEIILANI